MSRRLVQTSERTYLFSPDDPAPLGGRLWALVKLRVVDELTDKSPNGDIAIEANELPLTPRVTADGLVGLVAVPRQVFQALASKNYTVRLTVTVEGYLPRQIAVTIPNDQRTIAAPAPQPNDINLKLNNAARLSTGETLLVGTAGPDTAAVQIRAVDPTANQVTVAPALSHAYSVSDPVVPVVQNDFAPTDLGTVMMHRKPVVIRGRTVRANSTATVPLRGATISMTGLWRMPPPANAVVSATAPNLFALRPPLYRDRAIGETFSVWDLNPAVGSDKQLLDDVPPGVNSIRLSNREGLEIPGDPLILLIDAGQSDLAEFIEVSAVPTAGTADQPTLITLAYPTLLAHRRGSIVQPIKNPPPPGAPRQVDVVDAWAGDGCVFLDGPAAAGGVQISDEYHELKTFEATSGPDGFYRLPPLERVAQLKIHAEKVVGAETFKTDVIFRPDYSRCENHLDLVLKS